MSEIIERGADAQDVIDRMAGQIGELYKQLAVKDSLLAELSKENQILKESNGQ